MAETTENTIKWLAGDIPAADAEAKYASKLEALMKGGADICQAIAAINAEAIAGVLRGLGCEKAVTIEYSGSGDSSNGEKISDFPEPATGWSGVEVLCLDRRGGWYGRLRENNAKVRVDTDLETALSRLLDQVITANDCDGWENEEGGYGEVILKMDGTVTHTHNDYVTNTIERGTWTLSAAP